MAEKKEEDAVIAEIAAAGEKDPLVVLEAGLVALLSMQLRKGDGRVAVTDLDKDSVRVRAMLHESHDPAWRHLEWQGPRELWEMLLKECPVPQQKPGSETAKS